MEEIITLDGKQFKLTTDRPLTALERQQTISEIKKQTGCSSCHQPKVMGNMASDWQKLNVPQTPGTGTNSAGTKSSLSPIDLNVQPNGGVGPYKAWFYIIHNDAEQTAAAADGTAALIPTGRLAVILPQDSTGTNPLTGITEVVTPGPGFGATVEYTLDDLDVSSATGAPLAKQPSDVNVSTGAILFNATTAALTAGSIRFITAIADSCTGGGYPGTCAQWVDVVTTCVAPTCNFVVS